MLAAVYHGRDDVRVEDWPDPVDPPHGWVTVAVSWCGICGTDVDELVRGPLVIPQGPHPASGRCPPMVLGHEAMGTVVAVGEGAALSVGTRVGLENSIGCGSCERCMSGNSQLCEQVQIMGLTTDGALAEFVNVPASMCAPLPPGLVDEAGALAEPFSVAVRAIRKSGGVRGKTIRVFGAGTIGLMVAALARVEGARSVLLHDLSPHRVARAAAMSLDAVGAGVGTPRADIVFECTGVPDGFEASVAATAPAGVTVVLGSHAQPQMFDLPSMVAEERALVSSLSHSMREDYLPAVEMLNRGILDLAPLITDRVALRDVVKHGFQALIESPDQHLKMLVDCRV